MPSDPDNKSTKQNPIGRFMVGAGAVIELKSTGKILLVQRSNKLDFHPGEWEICYGRLDQFEDVKTGLKREVCEELGLKDIQIMEVLRIWHLFRGSEKAENELIGITFHCRTKTEQIHLSQEHIHYEWVLPEKALKMIHVEGMKEDIKNFMKNICNNNDKC